jgi:uncharacterized protein
MVNDMENIQSPCVRNCCLNDNDVCLGCFRTMSEIIAWGQSTNEERQVILTSSKRRAKESVNS